MTSTAEPCDYDVDPARFRANMAATRRYGLAEDVHEEVAVRLAREVRFPVLDLGCGEGRLTAPLRARGVPTVAFDRSPTMLAAVEGVRVQGEATLLPFADGAFGAVAALYMLYHLADPAAALAEAWRVLAPGGLFVAGAPSRDNDPELAAVLPLSPPATFDAENGPGLVTRFFSDLDLQHWDAPLMHLPDRTALAVYLRGRGADKSDIERALTTVSLPLTLTKRGALIYGRKRG